jgi:hypothetical protein
MMRNFAATLKREDIDTGRQEWRALTPFRYAAAMCVSQLQEEVSQMPKYRTWSTTVRDEVPQCPHQVALNRMEVV